MTKKQDQEDLHAIIKKWVWSLFLSLTTLFVIAAASQLPKIDQNSQNIEKNTKAIAELKKQGGEQIKIQTRIAVTLDFVAKENSRTNEFLDKLVEKTEKTAIEQAKRTPAIKAIRRHLEDTALHTP